MIFDPLYLLLILPAVLLAFWAQFKVKSAYNEAKNIPAESGLSGAETARQILDSNNLQNVAVEETSGFLSDHYDPGARVLRLSPEVYRGRSLAALGIAAHEAGHAIQHGQNYALLTLRNAVVPLASLGSSFSWLLLFAGFILHLYGLVIAGVALYGCVVFFQLVNLPVEYDASARAKAILLDQGMITQDEHRVVKKVLSAAALTYVAATLTAVLTLVYFLIRSGLLGSNRR
jgi:Zn-dependent membrane protease YugP